MDAGGVIVRFDPRNVQVKLEHLGQRAVGFDQSLLTHLLLSHVEEVFDSQGAKGIDGRWERLAKSTLIRHPRRRGGKVLHDTMVLGNFQTATMGDTSVVWSPATYAIHHVHGTQHMSARNPFAINMHGFLREAEQMVIEEIVG